MLVFAMFELLIYQETDGTRPYQGWFAELDREAAAKVTSVLQRMAAGNLSDVKSVGAGVMERRINWGPGYRVYFGREGNRVIILLGGGTKKRQQEDIDAAHSRWDDYKKRRK
jgi:putative addiction module killer protein